MNYDWQALLVFLGSSILLTLLGRVLVFRIPALQRMRELNREADRAKLSRVAFRRAVQRNSRTGLVTTGVLYLAVLPLWIDLEPRPLWRHAVDVVAVLMVFDLLYYLTHRFVFHGNLLRKVHALHHRAHTPTYIDALYVHPLETAIGIALFVGAVPLLAVGTGSSLHAFTVALAALAFTHVNTLNHTFIHLPRFPFRTLDTITCLHAAHHVDMNRGNFATLTMLYDWLFGTLERPVSRSAP